MHDLTAQVTSSLLPFPGVTIDALGEDEIILDSVLHGKFSVGRSGLAWLACGPQLEVVHAVTGERLSAYCFSGGGEHPPSVLAARDFSWLKRSGLLVGLEEAEGSMLCLYDMGLSRVVKAVVIPGRITAIEPLVSYGGASTATQHLHQSLRWFFGIAAVVTDLGHVLLVDLCLDDLSCSQSELEASDLEVVTKSPTEIPRLREASSRQGRHLCLQLNGPSGVGATALHYIHRTNQLAVGFSDGYLQMWNMKTLKKEYHSQLEGGRVPVYAFTFQEPENDPRNCCYLWAVQSAQDLEGDVVSLHLLQLAFSERKCLASGKILYEGLEYCEERFSQEVSGSAFPLRAQATNTRLLSCQTIEKFRPHPDRDDSMNEVASPDTSVSIFSWQVKAYGQGNPSTFVGIFDINRWYHAQMPDSLRTGECLRSCPYLAVWSLDPVVEMVSPRPLLDVVVHDRSLSRGLPFTCPPPEQFFNPTTYNFDATCLLNSGIVHLTCSGYQKETLSFLKKAAPCSSDIISSSYSRCLMSGLLSSRLADTQPSSLSQEEQLDAILSTAVETSSLGLITGCIKQWTAEEQPGSALNLRYILEWAWNKVVHTKEELDGICAPLFDSSSNFTDPQTMQLLQHSQRLLGNLSTIFHCLLSEAQELTQKGTHTQNMVASLISQYTQVVLWFCRTGLLPEGSDEDALQISRPFYRHSVISNYYTIRREELTKLAKDKWCADCLMIDGLVGQCGDRLVNLWKRDEGGTGQYPPPTLHALLDIYLLESIDEAAKHAIVIYLLLDVMYSFPNKGGASVESFPTAFAIPIGLVKLVQGLWLLDHHDHQSSLELLLHPATSQCQFVWQHERVLQALMCQGQHSVALRYFHITKPPLSSTSQAKLCLSVLLHNRCLVEAWSLLRQHSSRLNMEELMGFLYESCQELGLTKELLKLPLGLPEQECLEKFLQGTGGLQNRELLMVHYLQQANYIPALQLNHNLKMNLVNERDPKLKERSNARNSILEQYGKVLPRVQRKLAMERAKPYQHPSTIHREVSRPQPLSTIAKRSANEKVMSRAGFINSVRLKTQEVWMGKEATPQPSPGTRLLDLVVHPSCQTPQPLLSPPRPPSSWAPPKSISKAPELSLLQTPQVVKRARALAATGPVFSAFTPQSILRSSLRPTPVATPSASPGRSITPPLRSKESRITFIEESESPEPEKGAIHWSNGVRPSTSQVNQAVIAWQHGDEEELEEQPHVKFTPPEGGIPSPQLRGFESESSSFQEITAETRSVGLALPGSVPARLSLGLETSQASVRSTDTTLEFYDAPLSQDLEKEKEHPCNETDDDVVVMKLAPAEQKEPEPNSLTTTEQNPLLTVADGESESQDVKEDEASEEEMEIGLEQEGEEEKGERIETEKEDEGDAESSSKSEDGPTVDVEDAEESSHNHDGAEDEEEEEEEEEEGEEEEEDSGSEVEIIEEVQGNGRLPPLQPSPLFVEQRHPHFLPSLSEQEAAALSIITPEAELKVTTHSLEMEGEVVMVRLGADRELEADEGEDGETAYTELKPSTTLLVPLELVEGHHGLVDGAELDLAEHGQTSEPDNPISEAPSGFSLMLEVDEDREKEFNDEVVDQPELILLEPQTASDSGSAAAEKLSVASVPEPTQIDDNAEVAPVSVQEPQQDHNSLAETEQEKREEFREQQTETKMITRRGEGESEEGKQVTQVSSDSQSEPQPVSGSTTSQRRKKAPSTPTRRTTRSRSVTFSEAEQSEDEGRVEQTEATSVVPASPSRASRRLRQGKEPTVPASPPRRSARKAPPEPSKEEVEDDKKSEEETTDNNATVSVTSSASTPAKRRVSQRATPTRTSRRTRSSSEEMTAAKEPIEEQKEEEEDEATNSNSAAPTGSRGPSPAKRRTTQRNTPRRASRRILRSEVVPATLEILEEEEQDEVSATPVKTFIIETCQHPQVKLVPVSLPQSTKKTDEKMTENKDPPEPTHNSDAPPIASSRRLTRSKLWNHPEEDLPLLDTPLEVDSKTPVADALIKRLQDEEEKEEGGLVVTNMARARKRTTKSSVERDPSPPLDTMRDGVVLKHDDDEASEPSPVEHSFIYSPSRRRTRGQLLHSSIHSFIYSFIYQGYYINRTLNCESWAEPLKCFLVCFNFCRSKAALDAPPIAKVEQISPLPSPEQPVPRALKRIEEGEAPAPRMSLRRKRILDTVFTKPVTRRKKL
uniref:AT hook containing transcription factor 1 n=1 Tax=Myripristis murdjan TaxID=586833 RepID=A0A668A031_9TELE